MPHTYYVVFQPSSGLYMTGYNIQDPASSLFGNSENAVTYETLAEANTAASRIGGGTVGTPK